MVLRYTGGLCRRAGCRFVLVYVQCTTTTSCGEMHIAPVNEISRIAGTLYELNEVNRSDPEAKPWYDSDICTLIFFTLFLFLAHTHQTHN